MVQIEDVLDNYQDQLMSVSGVIGVGIGESMGQPVIVVMVTAVTPEIKAMIPNRLENFVVQVEITGEISAF